MHGSQEIVSHSEKTTLSTLCLHRARCRDAFKCAQQRASSIGEVYTESGGKGRTTVELLRKLLTEEIRVPSRKNLVQSRLFSEMLQKAILKYQNRAIETAAVIEELVGVARDMREAAKRGEKLNLTDDEVAFWQAR